MPRCGKFRRHIAQFVLSSKAIGLALTCEDDDEFDCDIEPLESKAEDVEPAEEAKLPVEVLLTEEEADALAMLTLEANFLLEAEAAGGLFLLLFCCCELAVDLELSEVELDPEEDELELLELDPDSEPLESEPDSELRGDLLRDGRL